MKSRNSEFHDVYSVCKNEKHYMWCLAGMASPLHLVTNVPAKNVDDKATGSVGKSFNFGNATACANRFKELDNQRHRKPDFLNPKYDEFEESEEPLLSRVEAAAGFMIFVLAILAMGY